MDQNIIQELHSRHTGKLKIESAYKLDSADILSNLYTPGVAHISSLIANDPSKAKDYTISGKTVAVISDGSAVLGLGDVGARASLPVLEGKAAIFKEFAGVDAYPIALETESPEEFVKCVRALALNFAAINLEDIAAPECFAIEQSLAATLPIPIMHDDQHATAIVTLAALKGALHLAKKDKVRIVISGAGAAGHAITKLLGNTKTILNLFIEDIKVCDSQGVIAMERGGLPQHKQELVTITNQNSTMSLTQAMVGADVFIGVSKGGIVTKEMVQSMNPNPIIFALANPEPEILPELAMDAGAKIIATGRSDFPNQVNNALVFPGIFKGLIASGIKNVSEDLKIRVAEAIYQYHEINLNEHSILPSILDQELHNLVAQAVIDSKS